MKPERAGEPEGSRLKSYPLLEALISRRFAKGMSMNGGRSAAKLDELARAPEVLLHLWIRGFGVRLDEP